MVSVPDCGVRAIAQQQLDSSKIVFENGGVQGGDPRALIYGVYVDTALEQEGDQFFPIVFILGPHDPADAGTTIQRSNIFRLRTKSEKIALTY